MKKVFSIILAVALVAATLTGCAAKAPTAADLKGKTVVIGVWGGNDAETASIDKMIANFTEKTGIIVEKKVYTDYNTQLKADIAGDVAPDVYYLDAFMAPYFIGEGVLAELDPTDVSADKFYTPLTDAFSADGKLYAVPKDYSTLALYYNTKWISEADLPTSQEELYSKEYHDKIIAKLPKGVAVMTYNNDLARLLDIAQMGGSSITMDDGKSNLADSAIVENLMMVYEAAKAKYILTPADLGKGWNGEALGNEKTAMMIEGNWVLSYLQQNFPAVKFGVAEVPTYKGENTTMTFTVGYALNAKAKEAAAGLEFIKYATGPEGMTTWCSGAGVLPSRTDVTDAMGVAGDVLKAPHIAGAAYATPWQKGVTGEVINKAFQNFFSAAVKGELTLEEAMTKADAEADNQIQ